MTTELIKQEILTPAIYDDNKIEQILADIKSRANSFVPDISTKFGRKEVASFAMKIAKCKTAIDGIGKDRVADAKSEIKVVDNQRKLVRDTLDELKEKVRKPLTDFENAEKQRVERLSNGVNALREVGEKFAIEWGSFSLVELQDQIQMLDHADDGTWEEFNDAAVKAVKESKEKIEQAIVKRMAYDAEQDELERLRKEAAEREQKERDERIRKEAEEKATQEAEIVAKREAEKAEAEKLRIIQEKEHSERKAKREAELMELDKQAAEKGKRLAEAELKATQERAKREAKEAVIRERERVEATKEKERQEVAKREANKAHKEKTLQACIQELINAGVDSEQAIIAVKAISDGLVQNISIRF